LIVLLLLGQLSATAQHLLKAAGGILLLYFAWSAFRQWHRPIDKTAQRGAPRTLFQAVLVNVLNPNPYLGWALVLGPAFLDAWRQHPANAIGLIVAFYSTLVGMLALFIVLAGLARFLGPQGQRALLGISAILLALLGTYLLITGLKNLSAD
jgi:threonine/homoserine/homoserine lactone efflux protein